MHAYYSTSTYSNPLAATRTSRFVVHPAAFSESAASHDNVGRHNLNSPTYPHPGCHPFDLCLCYLTLVKDYLSPKQLHYEPRYLSNPSTPGRAKA